MPKKKQRKPKLICKTPWLHRRNRDEWMGNVGSWWLCGRRLSRLFDMPNRGATIRLTLYDRKRSSDSVRVLFRLTHEPFDIELTEVRWVIPHRAKHPYPRNILPSPADRLIERTLLKNCRRGTIKSAWLEVEIED